MGVDPVSIAIGAAGSLIGGSMAANASANAAKEGRKATTAAANIPTEEQKREYDLTQKGYSALIGRGKAMMGDTENKFLSETDMPLEQLNQMKSDIQAKGTQAQQEASRQENLTLAQQGVRGGQAAILKGRASGQLATDLQNQIDELAYNEAARRRDIRSAYLGSKAAAGMGAYLQPGQEEEPASTTTPAATPAPTPAAEENKWQGMFGNRFGDRFGNNRFDMGNFGNWLKKKQSDNRMHILPVNAQ